MLFSRICSDFPSKKTGADENVGAGTARDDYRNRVSTAPGPWFAIDSA
jgi:hypothetical protein